MKRKITKMGNSVVVAIPHEVLEQLKAGLGDELKFVIEPNGDVRIKKYEPVDLDDQYGLEDFDHEFKEGLKNLFYKYDNALRSLADK